MVVHGTGEYDFTGAVGRGVLRQQVQIRYCCGFRAAGTGSDIERGHLRLGSIDWMEQHGGRVERIRAIDIARALAIIGVVFNHSVDGLIAAGMTDDASSVANFNQALYIFRMPALSFILGLFIGRGVEKRGTRGYIREKVTFALYVYFVWFVIQTSMEIATSSLKNTPRGWDAFLDVLLMPAHLWFMPFLATSALLISLAAPWRSPFHRYLAFVLIGVGSLLAWGWNPDFFGMRGLSLMFFSAVGASIGYRSLGSAMTRNPLGWAFSGLAALCGFLLLLRLEVRPGTVNDPDAYNLVDNTLSALAASLGIIVILSLAIVLSYVPAFSGWLKRIGEMTLEIYLAHVMVVAGVRILLDKLGINSVLTIVTLAILLGVAVPIVLAKLAPRFHLTWLFHPQGKIGTWSKAGNRAPDLHHVQAADRAA